MLKFLHGTIDAIKEPELELTQSLEWHNHSLWFGESRMQRSVLEHECPWWSDSSPQLRLKKLRMKG